MIQYKCSPIREIKKGKELIKMDWNLFWNAFGAIGGTLGAAATAFAVIVAL